MFATGRGLLSYTGSHRNGRCLRSFVFVCSHANIRCDISVRVNIFAFIQPVSLPGVLPTRGREVTNRRFALTCR